MNNKKFEYQRKDLPFLRIDILNRFIFSILFFAVFAWQFISFFLEYQKDNMSTPMLISTIFVLLVSLLMFLTSLMYTFKDFRTIRTIKSQNRCVSNVPMLFNIEKKSFLRLYYFITNIISLIALIVLVSSTTYALLEFKHFSTISYYLPILVLMCLTSFNASFHIKNEIKILETIREYYSIY